MVQLGDRAISRRSSDRSRSQINTLLEPDRVLFFGSTLSHWFTNFSYRGLLTIDEPLIVHVPIEALSREAASGLYVFDVISAVRTKKAHQSLSSWKITLALICSSQSIDYDRRNERYLRLQIAFTIYETVPVVSPLRKLYLSANCAHEKCASLSSRVSKSTLGAFRFEIVFIIIVPVRRKVC